ncbi:hypothetical protein J2Z48_001868 [Croceifilum oryzae]|uniref:Uncharacterized protein n=1 Tax=Croceifilum oryzae TaxID=1553429 RepID=A0AAJ1TEZ2_9BACL|nr:hypothetical protein [Croceifilum oryzae]MDQ0417695.1 hypothetical protein [Croceifilum oryzae]
MSERSLRVLPLARAKMDEADLHFHIFAAHYLSCGQIHCPGSSI